MSNPKNPTTGKDFFGQTLVIGDEVAFMRPHYRDLVMAKVIGFTPMTIMVEFNNHNGWVQKFRSDSGQMIKKPLDCPK